jgi:hypothetical protein
LVVILSNSHTISTIMMRECASFELPLVSLMVIWAFDLNVTIIRQNSRHHRNIMRKLKQNEAPVTNPGRPTLTHGRRSQNWPLLVTKSGKAVLTYICRPGADPGGASVPPLICKKTLKSTVNILCEAPGARPLSQTCQVMSTFYKPVYLQTNKQTIKSMNSPQWYSQLRSCLYSCLDPILESMQKALLSVNGCSVTQPASFLSQVVRNHDVNKKDTIWRDESYRTISSW